MSHESGIVPLIAGGAALVLLMFSGCAKKAPESTLPPSGTAPTSAASSSAEGSFHTELARGADQAGIRAYLQSVHPVTPKKFEVTWSADTIAVSREEALRALRKISSDGGTFTFASSDPVVSKLQPGKILWIWGIAIRRIETLGTIDDVTLVRTKPVPLIEAMPKADIEFETPVDFGSAYGVTGRAPPPAPARTSAVPSRPGLRPVLLQDTPGGAPAPDSPGAPTDASDGPDASDFVAGTRDGFTGKAAGFEYSLAYHLAHQMLSFELQARKEEESSASSASNEMHRDERQEFFEFVHEQHEAEHEAEKAYERAAELQVNLTKLAADTGYLSSQPSTPQNEKAKASDEALERLYQKDRQQYLDKYKDAEARAKAAEQKAKNLAMAGAIAKQVFYIISDNLDVRFRTRVDLSTATLIAAIKLATPVAGMAPNLGSSIAFKDLAGKLDLEMVARLGEAGTGGVSIPVAHIPVKFNIPVIIEGVPFVAQVAADFLAKIGLSGKHAAQHFHARFEFAGGGGFAATSTSQSDTNFNLSGGEPEIEETEASSPGVSGAVLAVQIPRLGFGLGLFDIAAAMGFVDHVVVLTMTNGAGVAALNPVCKRMSIDRVASVGADLSVVLPIPIVQTLLPGYTWKKEAWRAKQWLRVDPDIAMCRI